MEWTKSGKAQNVTYGTHIHDTHTQNMAVSHRLTGVHAQTTNQQRIQRDIKGGTNHDISVGGPHLADNRTTAVPYSIGYTEHPTKKLYYSRNIYKPLVVIFPTISKWLLPHLPHYYKTNIRALGA